MKLISLLPLFLMAACSPNSLDDFRHEGESQSRALLLDLKKIESREQLIQSEPKLKRHFEELIALMIEARTFQQKHPDDLSSSEGQSRSDQELREELRRIYEMEGGREIVERAQQDALVRLDAFERALSRRKEKRG
jgi:hypothetical protein